ncbi:MAG: 2-hydroxyacyl-CoA dehydratase [Planctomycetes bacterium]|nr:2-hydroxyacyl-CoA dehydratase [Planctomycetota bacterium]
MLPPPLPGNIPPEKAVGITTTVPMEVILASGLIPVDLNNVFVTAQEPESLLVEAERSGFPRTSCAWTKGLYGAVHRCGIQRVVGVTQGDCSNTHALMEMLEYEGVECLPFEYPHRPDENRMQTHIADFADRFGANLDEAEEWRKRLQPIRAKTLDIDEQCWQGNRVSGFEDHLWLVSTSDFCGDPERFDKEADAFLGCVDDREEMSHPIRLGMGGVPPIVPQCYEYLEDLGARVVYNETQRQFAMPEGGTSLAEQYTRFRYPYGIFVRLEDIKHECKRRKLDGLIHYVQSFCFRRTEDRILRKELGLPVLTIECDRPGPLSGQLKTRLEAFVQTLQARKDGRRIF